MRQIKCKIHEQNQTNREAEQLCTRTTYHLVQKSVCFPPYVRIIAIEIVMSVSTFISFDIPDSYNFAEAQVIL